MSYLALAVAKKSAIKQFVLFDNLFFNFVEVFSFKSGTLTMESKPNQTKRNGEMKVIFILLLSMIYAICIDRLSISTVKGQATKNHVHVN